MKLVVLIAVAVMVCSLASVALADVPSPLAVANNAIGGGKLNDYTLGVENGVGLNNIGLLIKTWGKVTFIDPAQKFFYIDDGSRLMDGTTHDDGQGNQVPNVGVRVSYDNLAPGNTIIPPARPYVLITGISSTFADAEGKIRPNLRPRQQDDVQEYGL